ncbi:MAG: DUF3341 domain-containing protein [Acidimicrobiia bacterium]|nr:DUF3341 domain-containing protein [Acidimicrobiia bacterium]
MSDFHAAKGRLYGLMAEFDNRYDLLEAAKASYAAGYRKMDAFSPMPIHGLDEAIGFKDRAMPLLVLLGGVVGCLGGFGLMYFITVIAYPMNVGGRPHFSWPAYIPPTFETTILCAAFAAVFGMLALNGLPRPHHPVFSVKRFALASRDRFFLLIEARDPLFHVEATRQFLEAQHAKEVEEVER